MENNPKIINSSDSKCTLILDSECKYILDSDSNRIGVVKNIETAFVLGVLAVKNIQYTLIS